MNRIFIVDDHPILRACLVDLLAGKSELEVVGTAASIRATLEIVEQSAPTLMLIDLSLEDGNGFQLVRELRRRGIAARVLILTGVGSRTMAAEALATGVDGYVLKEETPEGFLSAVETVLSGRIYLSPGLTCRPDDPSPRPKDDGDLSSVPPRVTVSTLPLVGRYSGSRLPRRTASSCERSDDDRGLHPRTTSRLIRF